MLLDPYRFGVPADPPISLGRTSGNGNQNTAADRTIVSVVLAGASGTINYLTIVGSSTTANNHPAKLVVYDAANYTTVGGSLLGSIECGALQAGETRTMELDTPISITSGNYYAFGIQSSAIISIRTQTNDANAAGRFFADTYSDGPLGTGPGATTDQGFEPIISGSTTGTEWDGGAAMGETSGSANNSVVADRIIFKSFVAGRDGTISALTILGSSAASSAVNFRLVVYEVAGPTSKLGNKVGDTAIQNGLGISEAKVVNLSSSVSVEKGKMYAFGIHTTASMAIRSSTAPEGWALNDEFDDGSPSPGGLASFSNTWGPVISATIA